MRFQEAMEANQKWGHFNGTTTCPVPADAAKPTPNEVRAGAAWDQDESVARYLVSQCLPNSTTVHLKSLTTAKERWTKVKSEFSVKSQYVEADMLTVFTELCFPQGGDVHSFLGQLHMKRKELSAVGVTMCYETTPIFFSLLYFTSLTHFLSCDRHVIT